MAQLVAFTVGQRLLRQRKLRLGQVCVLEYLLRPLAGPGLAGTADIVICRNTVQDGIESRHAVDGLRTDLYRGRVILHGSRLLGIRRRIFNGFRKRCTPRLIPIADRHRMYRSVI